MSSRIKYPQCRIPSGAHSHFVPSRRKGLSKEVAAALASGGSRVLHCGRNAEELHHGTAKKIEQGNVMAGVQDGHYHRLRDTFAVSLADSGVPLETVSILLGHKLIK